MSKPKPTQPAGPPVFSPYNSAKDHRGRTITLYRAKDRAWSMQARAEFPQDEFESVAAMVRDRAGWLFRKRNALPYVLGAVLLLSAVHIVLVFMIPRTSILENVQALTFVVIVVPLYLYFRHTLHGVHPHALPEALTAHHRCAACGYKLEPRPEADGCTPCPECGAAWRLPVNKAESAR